MKKTLLSVLLASAFSTAAFAAPIALPSGPLYFQFTNLEQTDLRVNPDGSPVNGLSNCAGCSGAPEGNWGIAQISVMRAGAPSPITATPGEIGNDIISFGSAPFFSDQLFPVLGGQITAMFYGSVITSNTLVGSVNTLTSQGGFIDLYWDDPSLANTIVSYSTLTPGGRTGDASFTGVTDGVHLARLAFASGINSGDGTIDIQGTIDTTKVGDAGSADSYANVVDVNGDGKIDGMDGMWAGQLNSDWFGTVFGSRDIRFSNRIQNNTAWNNPNVPGQFGQTSNDPGRAMVMPEPASLALVGLGLLGMMAARRRKPE